MELNREILVSIILLIAIIFVIIVPNIPYTESQFYAQNTDLNYIKLANGDYNGMYVFVDRNKLSVGFVDINSADINLVGYAKLDSSNQPFLSGDLNSLDTKERKFYGSNGGDYFGWDNSGLTYGSWGTGYFINLEEGKFYDQSGLPSFSFVSRVGNATNGTETINWEQTKLYDNPNGLQTLDWNARELDGNWTRNGAELCDASGNCQTGAPTLEQVLNAGNNANGHSVTQLSAVNFLLNGNSWDWQSDGSGNLRLYSGTYANYPLSIDAQTGAVTFKQAYTLPVSDGASAQVLTTDGSGHVSWQTPSGGGGSAGWDYNVVDLNRVWFSQQDNNFWSKLGFIDTNGNTRWENHSPDFNTSTDENVCTGGGTGNPVFDGIKAYYSLDSGFTDITGNGYDLTSQGSPSAGTGIINGDYLFPNGNNDYAYRNSPDFMSGDYTLSGWVKTNNNQGVLIWFDGSPNLWIMINSSGYAYFHPNNGQDLYGNVDIADGTWHYLAMTNVSGTITGYVDGASVGTLSSTGTSFNNYALGTWKNTPSYNPANNLDIDEVGIWDRGLSSTEISDLYNGGAGLAYSVATPTKTLLTGLSGYYALEETGGTDVYDSSSNADTATLSGTLTSVTGKVNNALDFDGGTVIVPNTLIDFADQNASVSFWFKGTGRAFTYISSDNTMTIDVASTYFYVYLPGSDLYYSYSFDGGTWYYATVTYDHDTTRLYINGTQVATQSNTSDLGSVTIEGIGGRNGDVYFTGTLDEFALWKGTVLDANQISYLYNSGNGYSYDYLVPAQTILRVDADYNNTGIVNDLFSAEGGSTSISTSTKKWGAGSLYLEGGYSSIASPTSTSWDFGDGSTGSDFTMSFWVNNSYWNNNYFIDIGSGNQNIIRYYGGYLTVDRPAGSYTVLQASWSPSTDTWYHIELTRKDCDWNLQIDGASVATANDCGTTWGENGALHIGDYGGGGSFGVNGYMDDIVIVKGGAIDVPEDTRYVGQPLAGQGDQNCTIVTTTVTTKGANASITLQGNGDVFINANDGNGLVDINGDVTIHGKLTADTIDPDFMMLNPVSKEEVKELVLKTVPKEKQCGASQFFDKDVNRMEYYVACVDKFYSMNGDIIEFNDKDNKLWWEFLKIMVEIIYN